MMDALFYFWLDLRGEEIKSVKQMGSLALSPICPKDSTPGSFLQAKEWLGAIIILTHILCRCQNFAKMYAIILAGGKGKRLWPLSTDLKPKQFIDLFGNGTMLQRTIRRVLPIVPPERIFIVTDGSAVSRVAENLPEIQKQNLIIEPIGRSTLPCVALTALHIIKRFSSDEMIAVFPSDHIIQNEAKFHEAMRLAEKIALDNGAVATIGIKPNRPEIGYGYIQIGNLVDNKEDFRIFNVSSFIEKPNKERVAEFLKTGQYLWNSGILICKISTFMNAIESHDPDTYEGLRKLKIAIGTSDEEIAVNEIYPKLRSVSIAYGIMEKASNIIVVEADIGWDDIGNWTAFEHFWKKDGNSNACMGQHFGIDTEGCIIYSPNKLVATIGVENMVIVETERYLLVCPKDRVQEVKVLAEKLGC